MALNVESVVGGRVGAVTLGEVKALSGLTASAKRLKYFSLRQTGGVCKAR